MKEGKFKTNVKPPYWKCKDCSCRGPHYDFEVGMWWWKKIVCPVCNSKDIGEATKRAAPPPAPQKAKFNVEDRVHLRFIYNRMANFHLENERLDYMIKFKEIIDKR